MKAWMYRQRVALDALVQVDLPEPEPEPGEVKLKMRAAALNHRDLAIAAGHYHVGVAAPLIPLSDGAGEVVAVGSEVTRFAVGDLVCLTYMPGWIDGPVTPAKARRRLGGPNDGTLAEYVVAHEHGVVRAPGHLSAQQSATLPVAAVTAWHSLFEQARVRPGAVVLVNGSGGVSIAAIQLAHAAGARVIALTRSAQHAARLRAVGADEVVVSADAWQAEVGRLAGGADVVLDVAGGPAFGQMFQVLKPGGQVLLVGYAAGTTTSFDMFDAVRRAATIHIGCGGCRADFEALVTALEHHRITPQISACLPVDEVTKAFALLSAGGHFGKIVLSFD
jgi:NADPH:quinone reductase-like Zn-dependent oxidoreductase